MSKEVFSSPPFKKLTFDQLKLNFPFFGFEVEVIICPNILVYLFNYFFFSAGYLFFKSLLTFVVTDHFVSSYMLDYKLNCLLPAI